jgi:CHAT domain-containing protein/Tfp pilus assembly protein PilF
MIPFRGWLLGALLTCVADAAARPMRAQNSQRSPSGVAGARLVPDTLRDALSPALAAIARAATSHERAVRAGQAHRLANDYATAWKDSFLIRQVALFESRTPAARRERTLADSLRLAGNVALGREGVTRAMRLWRESLRRAAAIEDNGVAAPALVAIGAGFYRSQQYDSATAYVEEGKALAVRIGDFRTQGNALGILASISKDRDDLRRAEKLYVEASRVRARSGDSRGIAADQNNLGVIARERGEFRAATRAFEKALAINRRDKRFALVALNLGNLAGVASDVSDYARSDSLYRLAINLQRSSDERAESAFMLEELGRLQTRRGDYSQATATFADALRIHEESSATAEAIALRAELAALQSATGHPEEALTTLRTGEQQANAAGSGAEIRAKLALARADLAVHFGAFTEADSHYVRAERLFTSAHDQSGRADARYGRALLLHLRGENGQSLKLLESGREAPTSASDRRTAALTQLLISNIQQSKGDFEAARRTLDAALNSLHALRDIVGEAAALQMRGSVELREGSVAAAERFYRRGLLKLGDRQAIDVRWRLHAGIAQAASRRGALDKAAAEFRVAIEIAEKTASRVAQPERRYGFLADKWGTYTDLALLEQKRGNAHEAFAISERLRARQLVDMLGRGRIAASRISVVQEQDYRRRVAEITQRLEVESSGGLREAVISAGTRQGLRIQLEAAQQEYSRLLGEVSERDPSYARLVSAATMSARVVSSHLKSGDVLLEYLLGDSACTVFVLTRDTVASIRLAIGHEALAGIVDFSRRAAGQPSAATQALWRAPYRRLHRELIDPIERAGFLRGKRRLVIVPHAELHFVPFAALIQQGTRDRFLIERFDIAYAPSATVWVQLATRRLRPAGRRVLALAPNADRLPASRREVRAIGDIYGQLATVRLGSDASERRIRAAAKSAVTIHLATFGVLNRRNPLFSFVQLAPGPGDNGRLEVNKVFGLGLSGQLVVLSACQTALGAGKNDDVPAGDDWIGLVQAFLQGGANTVVASLWPVDDAATALLMERFHRRLAANRPADAALAEAQRQTLRRPETAAPFYWAGFVVNGDSPREDTTRFASAR